VTPTNEEPRLSPRDAYAARVAAFPDIPYTPIAVLRAARLAAEAEGKMPDLGEPPAWVAEPSAPIQPRQKPRVQIPERRDDF
jgi:hypothetical protein